MLSRVTGRICRIWKHYLSPAYILSIPTTISAPLRLSLRPSRAIRLMSLARKRTLPSGESNAPAKKRRKPAAVLPQYHESPSVKNEDGSIQWPAPQSQIDHARNIILQSAQSSGRILIVPDKDADGLSAGAILRHTLMLLGVSAERIHVHLLGKGSNVHSELERHGMAASKPDYIFVLDTGSGAGPPLIDGEHVGLVIDHHYATPTDFPHAASYVTACDSPPVATSALLTYHICEPLHPDVASTCDWLCVVGTIGDLGNSLKWQPPFPDMSTTLKKYTKKTLSDVVSLVNAPRRTATYDVHSAWEALSSATELSHITTNVRLRAARAEVFKEVERCKHAAPQFSGDGKVAVFRIQSAAQIHPMIAARWAGHLQSNKLEIVMVANEGYLDNKVNFSCRIPRCARNRKTAVNIIESLKAYASLPDLNVAAENGNAAKGGPGREEEAEPTLLQRMGEHFARGHVQASGGIVAPEDFEELMRRMEVGVKKKKKKEEEAEEEAEASSSRGSPSKTKKREIDATQKNTLLTYFGKKS